MTHAWMDGEPAALATAIAEAAKLLAASRQSVIAGLGTDVAGARAAILLAERSGAVIDHMHSAAVLCDLEVRRTSGVMLTTPTETDVRADTLLVVGTGLGAAPGAAEDELLGRLLRDRVADNGGARRIIWLCGAGETAKLASSTASVAAIGKGVDELPVLLGALRARIAGRPTGKTGLSAKKLEDVAVQLKSARFGVAIWRIGALDALTTEMLCGLVNDLNLTTRFSTLPFAPADNAVGVLQACGWMTGLPMRTGFGRGFPEHDPWLFDADRLAAAGEADCVIWISAYRAQAPQWREAPPIIALTGHDAGFRKAPRVHIDVGRPGVDHAAVEHSSRTGTLAAVAATRPSEKISVAEAMTRIASAMPG